MSLLSLLPLFGVLCWDHKFLGPLKYLWDCSCINSHSPSPQLHTLYHTAVFINKGLSPRPRPQHNVKSSYEDPMRRATAAPPRPATKYGQYGALARNFEMCSCSAWTLELSRNRSCKGICFKKQGRNIAFFGECR